MQHLIKLEGAADIDQNSWLTLTDLLNLSEEKQGEVGAIVVSENESIIESELNLTNVKLIAFNFGKFSDGRAFSQARMLRESLDFSGDIRAMGDFIPDQVAFLIRCGFTSFACRNEEEKEIALRIKTLVTAQYQSDVIEKQPLFRRR